MDRALSRILLDLYSAQGLEEFRPRFLAAARDAFGGELTCHNEINLANGDSLSVLSDSISSFSAIRPAFFEHVQDHPSIQRILKANGDDPKALKTSDFISQSRWRGSGLYADFYRPLADVRYQLTIGQRFGDSLVFFAISRKHRDFSEKERALLSQLRPHFIQAYRNAADRSELQRLRSAAQDPAGRDMDRGAALVFTFMIRFGLSRREAEVLHALSRGLSNDEIAQALGISLSTVKTRLENVFRRLGVASRTAAAARALAAAEAATPGG